MRLLLDTHVFLWWRTDSPRLKNPARDAIATAEIVFVSVATAWEIAIKMSHGRIRLPEPVEAGLEASQFQKLPVAFNHAEAVGRLPHHHRDPFDRMLVAQAVSERLVLVTHDRGIEPYGIDVLWT